MKKNIRIIKRIILLSLVPLYSFASCATPAPSLPDVQDLSLTGNQTIVVQHPELELSEEELPKVYELGAEEIINEVEIPLELLAKEEKAKEGETIATLLPGTINDATVSVERRSDFTKSIAKYNFVDGVIYTLYCSPGHATDLRLEEGETLLSDPVVGDITRWTFSQGTSLENGKNIVHIFIRPTVADTSTTLILTTNKRTYYLKLISFETIYMFAVQFRYPNSTPFSNLDINADHHATIPYNGLDFNFLVEKRQSNYPSWKPVSVYADNKKTYIQLSPYFTDTMQAPTVYYLKDYQKESDLSLVNYSIRNSLYIIDMSLSRGEALMLVSGDDKVKVTKL